MCIFENLAVASNNSFYILFKIYFLFFNVEYHQNFRKADDTVAETFGLPYDFDSLMHYPANAFAKPGTNVTMFAKVSNKRSPDEKC